MFSLRRATIRVLSSSPSTVLSTKSRTFTSFRIQASSLLTAQKSFGSQVQRRFASEEAAAQSEPEADGASEARHGSNSIATAAAEELESQLSRSEEEEATAAAASSASHTDDATLTGTRNDNHGGVVSEAAASVAGTAAAVGESLAGAAGFGGRSGNSATAAESEVSKTVYVGNLFFDVRAEDLKQEFAQAGSVVDARVITDTRGLSKGFGYVDFDSVDSATKAIELYNLQNFEGRRISVQYSIRKASRRAVGEVDRTSPQADRPLNAPTKTLFIGNMSFDMSDRDLNNLFRDIKNVIDVRVAIDRRTGQPRGFSHADFTDVGSAERAMAELRGKIVNGRALRVDYSASSGRTSIGGGGGGSRQREGGASGRDRADDGNAVS